MAYAVVDPAQKLARSLRTRRIELGWSLDDVRQQTRIPRPALIALEAGRPEELPTGPVSKGFARAYAEAVGVDPALVTACWPGVPEPVGGSRRAASGSAWRWVFLLVLVLVPLCLLGWWLSRAIDDPFGEAGQALLQTSPTGPGPATMRG